MEPLVSIIIPVYNVESYLQECMDSICNQSMHDIEIICINDGSTDNSGTILEEYARKDQRITVIHSENRGLSSARNQGILRAKAPYVTFVDSDDYIAPTMCEMLYNAMITHDVDMVMCGIDVVFEEGQEYRKQEQSYYILKEEGIYNVDIDVIASTIVVVYAKLFKKALIEHYSIYFVEGRVYEDNYFTRAYLSCACSIYCIESCLLFRRFRKDSITDMSLRGRNAQHIDAIYQLHALFEFWDKQNMLHGELLCFFWINYINTCKLIETTLSYRYLHILLNLAGKFIIEHQNTIPPIDGAGQPLKAFLLEYAKYKDVTIRDIAHMIRDMKQKYTA